jgi:two-component sensor histidine kinase
VLSGYPVSVADLAIELDSTDEAPHEARQTIRARFAERLPAPALYDLLTVVSELVANGVCHGKGETVRVQIAVDGDGRIRGEVESDGRGTVAERPVDLDRQTGLGLRIVAALVERWRVIADGTTRVRFELRSP